MKKNIPQIFTTPTAQFEPVDSSILDILGKEEIKEALIRRYVKGIILEDATRRQALADDLRGAEEWPTQTASRHRRHEFNAGSSLSSGRVLKKAFHKHADKSFMSSLTTVHWADSVEMIISLLRGSSKDEISTSAYLPGKLKDTGTGAYGAYGLEIKGHISLLANNMDHIITGLHHEVGTDDSHRTKSSGKNKGVKKTYIPDAYGSDKDAIIVLDKADWNPSDAEVGIYNNEALVDNWVPVAIITSNEDFYEDGDLQRINDLAEEYNIEVKGVAGMYSGDVDDDLPPER